VRLTRIPSPSARAADLAWDRSPKGLGHCRRRALAHFWLLNARRPIGRYIGDKRLTEGDKRLPSLGLRREGSGEGASVAKNLPACTTSTPHTRAPLRSCAPLAGWDLHVVDLLRSLLARRDPWVIALFRSLLFHCSSTRSHRMPQGRQAVLDETARREVLALLSAGISRRNAAYYVGCAPKTIPNTMRRDPEFARQVRRAETHWELGLVHAIRVAGRQSWRANAWLLERVLPHNYGRRAPDHLTPEEASEATGDLVDKILPYVPRERLPALRRQMALLVEEEDIERPARRHRRRRRLERPAADLRASPDTPSGPSHA
jgi:hypothetical protein